MPTLSTGTGNQAVDIFYEVREGGASTSHRYARHRPELLSKPVHLNFELLCFRDVADPACLLMIMGEHMFQHAFEYSLRHQSSNVVLSKSFAVTGFAATLECWNCQLDQLLQVITSVANTPAGSCCTPCDNSAYLSICAYTVTDFLRHQCQR